MVQEALLCRSKLAANAYMYHFPEAGVVLFAMVAGHLPFYSRAGNKQELAHKILRGNFSCPGTLSADCADLLRGMLDVDPTRRLSCSQVRNHRWARAKV